MRKIHKLVTTCYGAGLIDQTIKPGKIYSSAILDKLNIINNLFIPNYIFDYVQNFVYNDNINQI